ncbi:Hypothetical predicted protein [Mytilus galloprovincialis]|uniref:PHD-type domain-containing protein n=1 Tax=Mytilus galloprovincialis TaxID=29158 RepID=A0A8B6DPD4_MYTGA|nr:Hypothetical predicted protein [Mytilus galloprovincialis]
MGRVTASKAHDVWKRKDTTSPDVLVKRIVGYLSYDLSKKAAVKWGVDHEEECRQAYIINQNTQHIDFESNVNSVVKTYVIRELVTRQLENQQATTQPPEENNNEKKTWCLCAEPEYGRMIKCDKSECPYQWFHYKCVNIRRKPKGKWYCLSCSE